MELRPWKHRRERLCSSLLIASCSLLQKIQVKCRRLLACKRRGDVMENFNFAT